jgi:hypothetical protein
MLLLLLSLSLSVSACGSVESDPPVARVQLLHSIEDLGALEVLVDDKVLGAIASNSLSAPFEVAPGSRRLAIRNQGAQVSVLEESVTLNVQGYLFALTGRLSNNSLKLLKVDQVPPALGDSEAAVEVIHLFTGAFRFDVYAGDALIAQDVGYADNVSPFVKVPAGLVRVTVYNAGSDPKASLPVTSRDLSLGGKSATLLVLQTDKGALSISPINIR